MNELWNQFVAQLSVIGGTAIAAILGLIFTLLVNKIKKKSAKHQEADKKILNEALDGDYMLDTLKNTAETYTKEAKKANGGTLSAESAAEAMNKAFTSLVKTLPKYLIKIAKRVYADWKEALKERLQICYEKNKSTINKKEGL